MPVTVDYDFDFDGLTINDGPYSFREAPQGLADMPPLRTSDLVFAGRDGQRFGTDLLDSRTVTLELDVVAEDDAAFGSAVATLRRTFQPRPTDTAVLTFQVPGIADGQPARLHCRPLRFAAPVAFPYSAGVVHVVVELRAVDPVLHSDTEHVLTTTLPTVGGGLTFDATFDMVFGTVGEGGTLYATNAGTWPADAVIRINGPVTNPRVENITTGQTLELLLAVGTGDYVLLDTKERTVMLNGTASRYSSLTADSVWWQLQPGFNEITFRATTDTAGTASLTFRSAWL